MPKLSDTDRTILAKLSELGGSAVKDEDIVYDGTKIVLPQAFEGRLDRAVDFLEKRREADERPVAFVRKFRFRPWDGAHATFEVIKRLFGGMGSKGYATMFGETTPRFMSVKTGPNEETTVPWDGVTLPIFENTVIYLQGEMDPEYGPLFTINAEAPRKYRFQMEGLFNAIQAELEANSIYRGKAFDGRTEPDFLDLNIDPEKVIYSGETQIQLEASVWSVLKYSASLRSAGQSLKRAVLLYGPYGTGKTLGASLTAKIANENEWTFIQARPGRDDLSEVMGTARLYQPSVVFLEDVDTLTSDTDQDGVTRLLDLFDGITSKGTEILMVLTTNHPERIHKGMLRPGRLDAVIEIASLDRPGIRRLVEVSVPNVLSDAVDWDAVTESMEGMTPAWIKEAADRAFRYSLARNGGDLNGIVLTTDDLVHAANGLEPHRALMEQADEKVKHNSLDKALERVVEGVVTSVWEEGTPVHSSLTADARKAASNGK